MVRHDWMMRVYRWAGIPEKECKLISQLMDGWKVRFEVIDGGNKITSRWIDIKKGFLQGDTFSPVGFCCTEIPIMMLLEESDGYKMGPPGRRETKRTHSLFIDDLKIYQASHQKLKEMHELLVQASTDTGAAYGVKKCAEAMFKKGKMVKEEGFEIIGDKMKVMDPDKDDYYKFLGCEQTNGINTKKVVERIQEDVKQRTQQLVELGLYERNLIKAINCRVIPVAMYIMNVCQQWGVGQTG